MYTWGGELAARGVRYNTPGAPHPATLCPLLYPDGPSSPPPSSPHQGVCLGLSEVLSSASRQQLQGFTAELLPTVKLALCDRAESVREAAGVAFNTLFKQAGQVVIDDIIPSLLAEISSDPHALDALKQILKVQRAILPSILPKLVEPPMTAFNARTLASLADVAGPGLMPFVPSLLPPLLEAMAAAAGNASVAGAAVATPSAADAAADTEESGEALHAAESVVRAVGVSTELAKELLNALGDPQMRVGAAHLIGYLCKVSGLGGCGVPPLFTGTWMHGRV